GSPSPAQGRSAARCCACAGRACWAPDRALGTTRSRSAVSSLPPTHPPRNLNMASDWLDLDAPPALPGLFLRAAVRHTVRGRQLPTQGLRCRIEVDARHLRRYHQVCDLPEDGYLPPAYPHI